jgi:ER-bound oxygenase mpaB/B'/Rubber oxygenase, catalytic domain
MAGANGSPSWTDALLDRMRELGDPLADGPVAALLERGGVDAVNAMMQALVRVDQPVPEEMPDEIRAYLVETLPLPDWARNELTPGMWHPDWGTPINQEDLAGTRMSFSYVFSEPMRRLGVRVPAKDVEAYLHLWNVIGHPLGVRDELLVHDIADATALVDTIRRRQFEASPEGQELTRALLDLMDELTPVHRLDGTIPPLIRHLIGDETADLLLIPKSDLADHLGPLARIANWFFVHVLGQIERDLPRYQLASRMAAPFGRDLLDTGLKLERGGDRAPFDIPDHLARTWDILA